MDKLSVTSALSRVSLACNPVTKLIKFNLSKDQLLINSEDSNSSSKAEENINSGREKVKQAKVKLQEKHKNKEISDEEFERKSKELDELDQKLEKLEKEKKAKEEGLNDD